MQLKWDEMVLSEDPPTESDANMVYDTQLMVTEAIQSCEYCN